MRAFIQRLPAYQQLNINCCVAYEGFRQLGAELNYFDDITETFEQLDNESIVVGGIGVIHYVLNHRERSVPLPLDYPHSLRPFLQRNILESTINTVAASKTMWGKFVKPKGFGKKFTGRVVNNLHDLIGCRDVNFDVPVWVSDAVDIVAEWRCYVRYGKIIGVRIYKGDWRQKFDVKVVEDIPIAYDCAPDAYAFDVGVTKQGKTVLIECNDGFSLGSYGLPPTDYAKLLSARWAELNAQSDPYKMI